MLTEAERRRARLLQDYRAKFYKERPENSPEIQLIKALGTIKRLEAQVATLQRQIDELNQEEKP